MEAEERFKDHTSKKVKVNGEIVNKPSVHVDALNQKVEYKDFLYLMLDKQVGFVSAVQDKFDRQFLRLYWRNGRRTYCSHMEELDKGLLD